MDDNIPLGKRICLRPISSTATETEEKSNETGEEKMELFTSGLKRRQGEVNYKRLQAQKLYKASIEQNPQPEQNPRPVRERIGGQMWKRRQGINNMCWYQYTNNQFFWKSRLRYPGNEPIAPSAQRRLNALQLKLYYQRMGLPPLRIKSRVRKSKFPNVYMHSIQASLDPLLQAQVKVYEGKVVEHEQIPNEPLPLDDRTSKTLNERFSSYP